MKTLYTFSVLFLVLVVALSGCAPSEADVANVPRTNASRQQTTPDSISATTTSATTSTGLSMTKCDWLKRNFPQSTSGVQQLGAKLANVDTKRVRTHLFPCSATETVFDGFIVLGPNEGFSGNVTMSVSPNGAIDSYPGAQFTGATKQIGVETIRGFDGSVTGVSMTFWPWLDENPPRSDTSLFGGSFSTSATTTATTSTTTTTSTSGSSGTCQLGKNLAAANNWQLASVQPDSVTKFGGAVIVLSSSANLPNGWMAQTGGASIGDTDTNRTMSAGTWSIYPPFACRDSLGVSK